MTESITMGRFEDMCRANCSLLKARSGDFEPRRDVDAPTSPWHLSWMLEEATRFYSAGKPQKANRWLGYVQGVMAALHYGTLEELKRANMPEGESYDPKKV